MKKPVKNRGGRPRKVIDYATAEKLSLIQCTQQEIASMFDVSVDTLQRDARFCGLHKSGLEKGKMSLRRHQWRALEAGNPTMLVWLGKQYLGQKDHSRTEISGTIDVVGLLEAARLRAKR